VLATPQVAPPPEESEDNHQGSQEQRRDPDGRSIRRAQLGVRELGELLWIQPLLLLERRGGCWMRERYGRTVAHRFAQNALDLGCNFRRICAGPQGNSNETPFGVPHARRTALHPVDCAQSRQHGRESVRSALSSRRQPPHPKHLLSAAPRIAPAGYASQAIFCKAHHNKEDGQPGKPASAISAGVRMERSWAAVPPVLFPLTQGRRKQHDPRSPWGDGLRCHGKGHPLRPRPNRPPTCSCLQSA
jgi:hypothetical protein